MQFIIITLKDEQLNTRQGEAQQGGDNTDKSITGTNFPSHSELNTRASVTETR